MSLEMTVLHGSSEETVERADFLPVTYFLIAFSIKFSLY